LQRSQIRNFRSIHNEPINKIESFNIFGGTNDSGKSNVLRALNLFFTGQTSFLTKFNFDDDYSKLALLEAREKKKGWQFFSIKIYFNEDVIQGKKELKKLAKANGGLWVKREWKRYEDTYRQTLPDFIINASQGIKRSFSVLLSQIKFIYIPAFKNADVFSHVLSMVGNEEGIFIDQKAKDTLNKQIALSATELAKDFFGLTNINTKVSLPITLDSFWSSLQVATEFKIALKKKIKRGAVDDYLIGLIARGEGIKSIFTPIVLGWLARNVKNRYWIWGIDEPENSLESSKTVSLFRKFLDYSKDAQIFVSSHSPAFIFPDNEGNKHNVVTYITTQEKEGDTKFKQIKTSRRNIKRTLIKNFGVDYGTFLGAQEEYAQKLRDAQIARDIVQKKLQKLTRPVIFVEGELDEIYFKKTVEILRSGSYPADIRWIGAKKGRGQVYFTGDSALDHLEAFVSANPDFIQNKIVLLYDVEKQKKGNKNGQVMAVSPGKKEGKHYQTGTEHLLVFPEQFDYTTYDITKEHKNGDKCTRVTEPDKKKLCDYVCKQLSADQQKVFLANIDNFLTILEKFFKKS